MLIILMGIDTQIVLATYNGEKYLARQLDSILAQTHTSWELLARDDGSTDGTTAILEEYAARYPDKIRIIRDSEGNLGYGHNFARLMEHTSAEYISFADQDDIWHPDKLERSVARLKAMEDRYGSSTPLLVHHDFAIINANDDVTDRSHEEKYRIGKDNSNIAHMLVQPILHGFSGMANRALIDKSLPLPPDEKFHDSYIAAVASVFGHIEFDPDQLADYRIHGNNVTAGKNPFYAIRHKGTTPLSLIFSGQALNNVRALSQAADSKQREKSAAAGRFLERYGAEMTQDQREVFKAFSRLPHVGKLQRAWLILDHGFLPKSRTLSALYLALG